MEKLFAEAVFYPQDIQIWEKSFLKNDNDVLDAVKEVGLKIAQRIIETYPKQSTLLLIGKGSNGLDALQAGICLLEKGWPVIGFFLFSEKNRLSTPFIEKFLVLGGKIINSGLQEHLEKSQLIIDGIFGIGFKGVLDEKVQHTLFLTNNSSLKKISIDIPSGLDPKTGQVENIAFEADLTLSVGRLKTGYFLGKGPSFTGELSIIPFESHRPINATPPFSTLPQESTVLPKKLPRQTYKYKRGVVLLYAGSEHFPGSLTLASLGALYGGAGMFYYYQDQECSIKTPPEWIAIDDLNLLKDKHIDAILIGPGIGRSEKSLHNVKNILKNFPQAFFIIDADALFFWDSLKEDVPPLSILTPHGGEARFLLGHAIEEPSLEDIEQLNMIAKRKNIYIFLKGASSFIFCKGESIMVHSRCPSSAATAGSGDLWGGLLTSLLAYTKNPLQALILSLHIQRKAVELSEDAATPIGVHSSLIAKYLPPALKACLNSKDF